MPEKVAARVLAGHVMDWDPPHPLSAVRRWTCKTCGCAVLDSGTSIYGSATQITCEDKLEDVRQLGNVVRLMGGIAA